MAQTVKRKLYSCVPLRARILARQCEINRQIASGVRRAGRRQGTEGAAFEAQREQALEACRSCPGVQALARRKDVAPPSWVMLGATRAREPAEKVRAGWARSWRAMRGSLGDGDAR